MAAQGAVCRGGAGVRRDDAADGVDAQLGAGSLPLQDQGAAALGAARPPAISRGGVQGSGCWTSGTILIGPSRGWGRRRLMRYIPPLAKGVGVFHYQLGDSRFA